MFDFIPGEIKQTKKTEKSDDCDDSIYSDSDDGAHDTNDLAKKARLDEDPELRRMVMEVIFGSSETVNLDKPGTSTDVKRFRDCTEVSGNISNSSSSESEANNLNQSVKSADTLKSNKRLVRAVRNRTKVVDKDFIYDLDAVLLKEPIEKNVLSIDITDNNKPEHKNDIGPSKLDVSEDLTVLLDVVETTYEKVV